MINKISFSKYSQYRFMTPTTQDKLYNIFLVGTEYEKRQYRRVVKEMYNSLNTYITTYKNNKLNLTELRQLNKDLLKEDREKAFKNKVYEKLRNNREVKENIGIIYQNPIIKINKDTAYSEISKNDYAIYINDFFREDILKRAHEALYKDDEINNANIKAMYAFPTEKNDRNLFLDDKGFVSSYDGVDREDEDLYISIRHTEAIIFEKNTDVQKLQFNLNAPSSNFKYMFIGYQIAYSNKSGDFTLTHNKLDQLKAYSPCSDRKYNEITCASTTNNKICIYETFLDITGINKLKYMRDNEKNKNKMMELLKNEGEEIETSVLNGELIKSIKLLTKKYNNKIIIDFYVKDNKERKDKAVIIKKGELKEVDDLNKHVGTKGMLYYMSHVSPFIVKKYEKDELKNINTIKYKMTPEKITGNAKKIKNVLGYDTEIYRLDDGTCRLFNITLYGYLNNDKIEKSFYGDDCLDDFVRYIDYICTEKDNRKSRPKNEIPEIYIYGFNSSKFDNLLIYDKLKDYNKSIEFIFCKSSIKRIIYNNITFLDLNLYYQGSLSSVAQSFKLDVHKGIYPYTFVNKDNIYYKGKAPEEKYFNNGDYALFLEECKDLDNFDLKTYTEKYCLLDSQLCYEIAIKHLKECVGEIDGRHYNVQSCVTGAGIALKMFKQVFLNDTLNETPEKVTINERFRYKGGRTEVFKKEFDGIKTNERLYYFDINSSYPASMTQEMPYRYVRSEKFNNKEMTADEIKKCNGYFASVEYVGDNKHFIPNILIRTEEGDVMATNKSDFDWHWGCELIEAYKNGCKIIVNECEHYETKKIFEDYANYFYNERLKVKKTDECKAMFYKLLLNSLYGKFGQKTFTSTEIVNNSQEMYNNLGQFDRLINFEVVNNKIIMEYETKGDDKNVGKLIRFSSYISALSRCNLSEVMRDIGHENIYYCDTDSIFTSKKPSDKYIDNNILGKWKEETKTPINRALFLAPKTYYYNCDDNINDMKAKGIKAKELSYNDYNNVLKGEIMKISQENNMFFRSYEGVKINITNRDIRPIYNKRIWNGNNSTSFKNVEEWRISKQYKPLYDKVVKELIKIKTIIF